MKKILAMILALAMVFALCACGGSSAPAATTAPAASESAAPAAAAEPAESAAPTLDWPKKNIRLIVGYGAGGDTDLAARVLADAMSNKLGVSVVVENLTGGTGVVGRTEMLSQAADGYTLMFDQFGSCITQVLKGNTTYTLEEAGTPICNVGSSALALCVAANNAKGITDMQGFIDAAKAAPGEITYSIPGAFTFAHLAALSSFAAMDINVASVPTDGTATAVTEALGGHVDAVCVPFAGVKQYIESGDMILLGVSAPSTFAGEDAPLMTDFGGVEIAALYHLWAPVGLDPQIAQFLSDTIAEILEDQAVVESLNNLNIALNFIDYAAFQNTVVEYRTIIHDAMVAGGAIAA